MTQAQLADKIGVNVATVARYEQNGIPERGPARALLDLMWSQVEAA